MSEVIEFVDDVLSEPIVEYKRNFMLSRFWQANPKQILSEIEFYNGMKILDIGCGTGNLLFEMSNLIANYEFKGIDTNPRKIDTAESKLDDTDNIEFLVADAAKLPFKTNYFDVIVCTNTFCYLEHKGKALQETYRVLKQFGRFLILESVRNDHYKKKLDKIIRQSPFIKYSRRFLNRTALFAGSYLISCQK